MSYRHSAGRVSPTSTVISSKFFRMNRVRRCYHPVVRDTYDMDRPRHTSPERRRMYAGVLNGTVASHPSKCRGSVLLFRRRIPEAPSSAREPIIHDCACNCSASCFFISSNSRFTSCRRCELVSTSTAVHASALATRRARPCASSVLAAFSKSGV